MRVPFPGDPSTGSLVIELPKRFVPGHYRVFWRVITNGVIPGLFTLLLCVGLYRLRWCRSIICVPRPMPGVPTS
jgi:two-component system sensor histidine kinase PfeS